MDIAIAAEGVTDQQTLQNMLLGFFKSQKIELAERDIRFVQPHQDASDEGDRGYWGSWTNLISYLKNDDFVEDLNAHDQLIVQIDTDICHPEKFDVDLQGEKGAQVGCQEIVEIVTEALSRVIDENANTSFSNVSDKIIFAISVHSIECWIFKYYTKKRNVRERSLDCWTKLDNCLKTEHPKSKLTCDKSGKNYATLTKAFRKPKEFRKLENIDPSLDIFIGSLLAADWNVDEDDDW